MTKAIDWAREKMAAPRPSVTSPLICEDGTFDVTFEIFKGNLPRRMIKELARADLVQTDTVDESLYVAEKGNYVEFSRTVYTKRPA